MHISTEDSDFFTDSTEQIESAVRTSREIWISGREKYPCLALLTNGGNACVNYFGANEGDMWMSRSESTQSAIFLAGGVEWEAPADAVISIDTALQCVREFCLTLTRPDCIKWQYGV